jgi:hypothetical protein
LQSCRQLREQTSVMATNIENTLYWPANVRLNMRKQTRPKHLIGLLKRSVILGQ